MVTVGRAAELHVAADGSGDYPTIQAVYDAAQSGDEVVLADGTFTGEGTATSCSASTGSPSGRRRATLLPGVPQVGFGESLLGFVRVSCSVVEPGALHEDVSEEEGVVEADPLFCDPDDCSSAPTDAPGDYDVAANSPCLAEHHPCGVTVGNIETGCDAVPVAAGSWSVFKNRFDRGPR